MGVPKWVMCMVCGDVLYGGPGVNPIPRECGCHSTMVLPMEDRGYVRWNKHNYEAAAAKQAQETRDKILRQAAIEEAEMLKSFGMDKDQVQAGAAQAMEKARPEADRAAQFELDNFPKEPEVEYTDEQLDPYATRVAVPQQELSKVLQHHYDKLDRGETV